MPRNDRSDSLSARDEDDPRRVMKGMQQEVELELGASEARDTGGVEHQSRAEREGVAPGRVPPGKEGSPAAGRAAGGDAEGPARRGSLGGVEGVAGGQAAPDAPGGDEHP